MAKAPKPASEPATEPVSASKVEETTAVNTAWSYDIPENMPYVVDGRRVVRLTAEPINFNRFVKVIEAAELARARDGGKEPAKYMLRERLKTQIKAWGDDGTPVVLVDAALMMMPIKIAARAREGLNSIAGSQPGELLGDNDGISSPILYKLGQPLRMGDKDGGAWEITEIEIQARTLGDVEDVVAMDGAPLLQSQALIAKCAKPIGGPVQLQALPSWALDQISIADGLFIAQEVVPRFLD